MLVNSTRISQPEDIELRPPRQLPPMSLLADEEEARRGSDEMSPLNANIGISTQDVDPKGVYTHEGSWWCLIRTFLTVSRCLFAC